MDIKEHTKSCQRASVYIREGDRAVVCIGNSIGFIWTGEDVFSSGLRKQGIGRAKAKELAEIIRNKVVAARRGARQRWRLQQNLTNSGYNL